MTESEIQTAFTEKLAEAGIQVIRMTDLPTMVAERREARCVEIADQVVPAYRSKNARHTGCGSHTAKRWQAAYDGAMVALGGVL